MKATRNVVKVLHADKRSCEWCSNAIARQISNRWDIADLARKIAKIGTAGVCSVQSLCQHHHTRAQHGNAA